MKAFVFTLAVLVSQVADAEPRSGTMTACRQSGGRWLGQNPEGGRCLCEKAQLLRANSCNALAALGDVCVTLSDCAKAEREAKAKAAPPAPAPPSALPAPSSTPAEEEGATAESASAEAEGDCPKGYRDLASPCTGGTVTLSGRTCFCKCPSTHRHMRGNWCKPKEGAPAAVPPAPAPSLVSPAPSSPPAADQDEGDEAVPPVRPATPSPPGGDGREDAALASDKSACERICERTEGEWNNESATCECPKGKKLDSSIGCSCVKDDDAGVLVFQPEQREEKKEQARVSAGTQGAVHAYSRGGDWSNWTLSLGIPYLNIDSDIVAARGGGISAGLIRTSPNAEIFGDAAFMITSRRAPRGFSLRLGFATTPLRHLGLLGAVSYSALGITSRNAAEVSYLGLHVGPVLRVFDALRLEFLWSPGWVEHRQEKIFTPLVLHVRAGVAWAF